jgi:hypothetical protein
MMRRGLPLRRVDVAPSTSPASKRRLIHRPTINAGAWSKANNVATAPTSAPGRPAPHAITDAATSKASPTPSHRRQRSGASHEVHLLAGGEVSKADQLPSVRHAEYEEAAASRHQAAVDDELDVLALIASLARIGQRDRWVVADGVQVLSPGDAIAVALKLRAVGFDFQVEAGGVGNLDCFVGGLGLPDLDVGEGHNCSMNCPGTSAVPG